ncbi:MAG: RNA polymerase factor sigma-54 [Hyphomicrobiaceae bacterium]|nr:MAG: RNA polymerase factor sigma-54 [Hyphomicrobiaceae bacterium]
MAISAKLELRQSQQLVMTPQLQQAIKLLQLSNLELNEFVDQELERNPLLERAEGDDVPASEREAEESSGEEAAADEPLEAIDTVDREELRANAEHVLDTELENVVPDAGQAELAMLQGSGWSSLRQRGPVSDEDPNLEAYASETPTLRSVLEAQAGFLLTEPAERLIGQHLIDMVDEAGYLRGDIEELTGRLGAPMDLMERVIGKLQKCEPAGVFARSLPECLALQLKDQNRFDPQIAALLDHLDLVASRNFSQLKRICACDADEIMDMLGEIKRLNPKPGLKYGSEPVQPIVPDVLVRPRADGSWIVELNSDTLPKVLLNQSYFATVSRGSRRDSDKVYLQNCLQTANWLIKSLDQRARTILKVAEEIIRQQDAFLMHGVRHLRPMNLKTVADAISMHESTVSRVTSNKYMATPRGIFELKYFFTSAIAAAGEGESHSSEAVRHRIKEMIEAEKPCAVLSDDRIVERLKADGVDIARRTVAKYREALRIPSSVQRRREKRPQGGGATA